MDNVLERPGYAVFTVDHNVVLIWKQPPTLAGVDECRRLFGLLRTRRPKDKFGYLAIVESRAGTNMPSDVRDSLSTMLRDYQQVIAASAIVFEGTGFRASIVRSVVAAIHLAARFNYPSTVESDVGKAATWLASQSGGKAITTADLIETVRAFRSRPGYAAQLAN